MTAAWRRPASSTCSAMSATVPRRTSSPGLARAVYDDHGAVGSVVLRQLVHQLARPGDREVDHQGGPGRRERCEPFAGGHRGRARLRPGEYDGLRDQRHGQLTTDERGRSGVRRDARRHVPGHSRVVEPLGLLGHRGVHRRVAGDQPDHLEAVAIASRRARHDLVEVEVLGVDEVGIGADVHEEPLVEIGARIEHDVGIGQQRSGAEGQQVGRTGTGPDEVHGHSRERPHRDGASGRPAGERTDRCSVLDGVPGQLAAVRRRTSPPGAPRSPASRRGRRSARRDEDAPGRSRAVRATSLRRRRRSRPGRAAKPARRARGRAPPGARARRASRRCARSGRPGRGPTRSRSQRRSGGPASTRSRRSPPRPRRPRAAARSAGPAGPAPPRAGRAWSAGRRARRRRRAGRPPRTPSGGPLSSRAITLSRGDGADQVVGDGLDP